MKPVQPDKTIDFRFANQALLDVSSVSLRSAMIALLMLGATSSNNAEPRTRDRCDFSDGSFEYDVIEFPHHLPARNMSDTPSVTGSVRMRIGGGRGEVGSGLQNCQHALHLRHLQFALILTIRILRDVRYKDGIGRPKPFPMPWV